MQAGWSTTVVDLGCGLPLEARGLPVNWELWRTELSGSWSAYLWNVTDGQDLSQVHPYLHFTDRKAQDLPWLMWLKPAVHCYQCLPT